MKTARQNTISLRWAHLLALLLSLGVGTDLVAQAPAAPPVGVIEVQPQEVELTRELPARVVARRLAEVRARVNGIVLERTFTEGQQVEAGELLFHIDPEPYEAALDSANASLARAKAQRDAAQAQAARYQALVESDAVSRQQFDDATAQLGVYEAEIASAQAAVRNAEINLGYTRVTAPISGCIGRSEVTEGAYVLASQATLLATIRQLDPVYVDFNRPAVELQTRREALTSGALEPPVEGAPDVALQLATGSIYEHRGTIRVTELHVDPQTGTVGHRAEFPNPDQRLLPGEFLRIIVTDGTRPDSILVPQNIVSRNPQGQATALVVGEGNTVELRVLHAERAVGNQWLITEGLAAGDRVIAEGRQKIRPGMPVTPHPIAAD